MARLKWPRFGLSLLMLGALRGHSETATGQPDCTAAASKPRPDCAIDASLPRVAEPSLALAEVYEPGTDLTAYLVRSRPRIT